MNPRDLRMNPRRTGAALGWILGGLLLAGLVAYGYVFYRLADRGGGRGSEVTPVETPIPFRDEGRRDDPRAPHRAAFSRDGQDGSELVPYQEAVEEARLQVESLMRDPAAASPTSLEQAHDRLERAQAALAREMRRLHDSSP